MVAKAALACAFLAGAALALAHGSNPRATAHARSHVGRRTPQPGPPPRLFAFLSGSRAAELSHLRRYGERISVLAPNWYELNLSAGTLTGAPDPAVVKLARAAGAALWPVVNARLDSGAPLAVPADRARAAALIAAEVSIRRYPGATLDIEHLPAVSAGDFDALVAMVAETLHARGERLAVYVPRRTAHAGDTAYNWRALARSADLLIASGYDEHSSLSEPGPVTSATGFNLMLDYAASVSRYRVAPALGSFGYSWPRPGGRGALISTIEADRERTSAAVTLISDAGGDVSFALSGRLVHYQDAAGLIARARDARADGMRWLALFSLGREPDAFWSAVSTARQA